VQARFVGKVRMTKLSTSSFVLRPSHFPEKHGRK